MVLCSTSTHRQYKVIEGIPQRSCWTYVDEALVVMGGLEVAGSGVKPDEQVAGGSEEATEPNMDEAEMTGLNVDTNMAEHDGPACNAFAGTSHWHLLKHRMQ